MAFTYIPPPIIHQVEESRIYGNPHFYECEGSFINLAAATRFYIDHIPLTNYYCDGSGVRAAAIDHSQIQ